MPFSAARVACVLSLALVVLGPLALLDKPSVSLVAGDAGVDTTLYYAVDSMTGYWSIIVQQMDSGAS